MQLILVIGILIILLVGGFFLKNNLTKKREEEERLRKIAEEEERKRRQKLEEEAREAARKAEIESGKELYHYLNQSIKTMFYHYRTQKWDDLDTLGKIELTDCQAARRFVDKLSAANKKLVTDFFACIDLDQMFAGEGKVVDKESLKSVFESMMLPFFPVYYKEFSNGPRYISFLNYQILKVFSQLSGKKFRLGYKNRYQNGQTAFEWTNDVYRVFRADGTQLCEASFADGKVKDGYAIVKISNEESDLWDVYQKGYWKDGILVGEDLHYMYKIHV